MNDNIEVDKEYDSIEDKEIYEFGLSMLKTSIIGLIIALIICIITREIIYGMLIVVFLLPLRQNAGGFHLDSKYECLFVSFIIYFYLLMVTKYLQHSIIEIILLYLLSLIIILCFAPVDSANNKLEIKDIRAFRKRTMIIIAIETVVFIITLILNNKISIILSYDYLVCALLVVFGKVKNIVVSEGKDEVQSGNM